jgi:hypothetical protein
MTRFLDLVDAQRSGSRRPGERLLIDPRDVIRGVLGSVFDALVGRLPANPAALRPYLENHDDELIERHAVAAARQAAEAASEHYARAAERTMQFARRAASSRSDGDPP